MIAQSARSRANEQARVVVVEPDVAVRKALKECVGRVQGLTWVATHATQAAAVRAMRKDQPDLILLDIDSQGEKGLELVRELGRLGRPRVVILATSGDLAADAFDLGAVDFLRKPPTEERVIQALRRAREILAVPRETSREGEHGATVPRAGTRIHRLLVQKAGRSAFFLPVEEIRLLEAEQNYVRIHYDGGTDLVRSSLNDLEERLDPSLFRRVHRSYIVNLEEVDRIEARGVSDYQVVMNGGRAVPVGRVYRDHVLSDA